jgi:acetyl esterase/lipase
MDGDARIRLISNNGLEMVRKPVKTAVKRHGGGFDEGSRRSHRSTSERATAVELVVMARSWKDSPLSY